MSCDCLPEVSTCQNHSLAEHLFVTPFCEQETLLVKILTVFFHVLTLGIPLLVYNVVACCFPEMAITPYADLVSEVIDDVVYTANASKVKAALEFAQKELAAHADVKPRQFHAGWSKGHQPINEDIAKLATLFWQSVEAWTAALKLQVKKDPAAEEQIAQTSLACMRLAFAIGYLTLEEIPTFQAKLAQGGTTRSPEKVLTEQDSYQYRAFFYPTNFYHWARAGCVWDLQTNQLAFPQDDLSRAFVDLFYTDDTTQRELRWLYNLYCYRVAHKVDPAALRQADGRFPNWTQPELRRSDFSRVPDTQPT